MCVPTTSLIIFYLTSFLSLLGYADINIPIFFGLYAFWKVVKKTKVWRPEEMDFVTVSRSPSTCSRPLLRYFNALSTITTSVTSR